MKEIQYEFGLHIRTAQRIAKALEDAGWITSKKHVLVTSLLQRKKRKHYLKHVNPMTATLINLNSVILLF